MYRRIIIFSAIIVGATNVIHATIFDAKTLLSLTTEQRELAITALEVHKKSLEDARNALESKLMTWGRGEYSGYHFSIGQLRVYVGNDQFDKYFLALSAQNAQIQCKSTGIDRALAETAALLVFARGLAQHEQVMLPTLGSSSNASTSASSTSSINLLVDSWG